MPLRLEVQLSYDPSTGMLRYSMRNTSGRALSIRKPNPIEDLHVYGPDGDRVGWRCFGWRVPEVVALPADGLIARDLDLLNSYYFMSAGPHAAIFAYRARTWTAPSTRPWYELESVDDVVADSEPIGFVVPEEFMEEWEKLRVEARAERKRWKSS